MGRGSWIVGVVLFVAGVVTGAAMWIAIGAGSTSPAAGGGRASSSSPVYAGRDVAAWVQRSNDLSPEVRLEAIDALLWLARAGEGSADARLRALMSEGPTQGVSLQAARRVLELTDGDPAAAGVIAELVSESPRLGLVVRPWSALVWPSWERQVARAGNWDREAVARAMLAVDEDRGYLALDAIASASEGPDENREVRVVLLNYIGSKPWSWKRPEPATP